MRIWQTSGRELASGAVGKLLVVASGRKIYGDEAWNEYLGICKEMHKTVGPLFAALNYSPIVGPSATQRRRFSEELVEELKDFRRVVLVSDSAMVRGALTAVTWLNRNQALTLRPFSPARVDDGLTWLREIIDFDVGEAKALLLELIRAQGDDPMGLLRAPGSKQ